MRTARLLLIPILVWAGTARAQGGVPAPLAAWLEASNDHVVARAYVPSAASKVGEVRILKRGDATVVETLLYTKLLSRVVGEIRKKELANWPGDPDAARYVDALEQAQKLIWSRLPSDERRADRRQKLWIDFIDAPDVAFVAVGSFEMQESDGEVQVLRREPLALLELSPAYVRRNLRLIAVDALHLDDAAATAQLGPPR